MPPNRQYVLFCAPSGSDMRNAVAKLIHTMGGDTQVEHCDIEETLWDVPQTLTYLEQFGPKVAENLRRTGQLTWHLPRAQISKIWKVAATSAVDRLSESNKPIRILTCHLIYYGGQRDEFYSPVNNSVLITDKFRPSHVILLIDDVYDMYLRLSRRKGLYDPHDRFPRFLGRLEEEEQIRAHKLSKSDLRRLFLEWQIDTQITLLSWRHSETLIAEKLAQEAACPFIPWATKQLSAALLQWITAANSKLVYVSHPITRVRNKHLSSGHWPDLPTLVNNLQALLLDYNLITILPAAIDEYRIKKVKKKVKGSQSLSQLLPILDQRWPFPQESETLYVRPPEASDIDHEHVLNFKEWNFEAESFSIVSQEAPVDQRLARQANVILRTFVHHVESQMSARDHLYVSLTDGILVFRPLYHLIP